MGHLFENNPKKNIERLQLRFLAYSYLYYVKDVSLTNDSDYDNLCNWLVRHMKEDEAKETRYYNLCHQLDTSGSAFYLSEEDYPFEIIRLAYKLQRQKEESREITIEELDKEINSKFKIIIAGSRDFNNYSLMKRKMDSLLKSKNINDVFFISGGARGADLLGEKYAREKGAKEHHIWRFIPNWNIGRQAGFIRNAEMAEFGDALVAFWNGSNGTKHMIDQAKKKNLQVRVVDF